MVFFSSNFKESSKLSTIFNQSKQFREEIYLNLMGNTSLCLMKLKNYKDASRYLEIMISLGTNKLKFYLRLAVCFENLGEFQKALEVLEVKAKKSRSIEKDEVLIRKANYMVNTLKNKMKVEEDKQEDLFRKCFNLKNDSEKIKGIIFNLFNFKLFYLMNGNQIQDKFGIIEFFNI